jgi:hypothetical protein
MFGHDLFAPLSQNGVIFQLQHSSTASYAPFRWDETSHTWNQSKIALDKFMTLPSATPAELAAVGFAPCDLRLQQREK